MKSGISLDLGKNNCRVFYHTIQQVVSATARDSMSLSYSGEYSGLSRQKLVEYPTVLLTTC